MKRWIMKRNKEDDTVMVFVQVEQIGYCNINGRQCFIYYSNIEEQYNVVDFETGVGIGDGETVDKARADAVRTFNDEENQAELKLSEIKLAIQEFSDRSLPINL